MQKFNDPVILRRDVGSDQQVRTRIDWHVGRSTGGAEARVMYLTRNRLDHVMRPKPF